jgi:hypothetical protein
MSNLVSVEAIQKGQLSDMQFSQHWVIRQLKQLTPAEFNRFCREVMHLGHHYDMTVGLIVTDKLEALDLPTWQIEGTDFDKPVTFRKIK